jgi:LPXTG-motif cell wall-anchored protein
MSPRKFLIGTAIVSAGLAGGSVAASDYPPDVPPPSTVLSSSQGGEADGPTAIQRPSQLPETGSDSGMLVKIAGGALVAGAGLVVVTRRRRHPAAA